MGGKCVFGEVGGVLTSFAFHGGGEGFDNFVTGSLSIEDCHCRF